MDVKNVSFSVNMYDRDGDAYDECVLIYVGDSIMRFDCVEQLKRFRDKLSDCINEIEENY